jgi:hypothetical protein
MEAEQRTIVTVRRQWNDWRFAEYNLEDVQDLHWTNGSGGVYAPAPQLFVHGYVWCNQMLSGELAHTCQHGKFPHRIKVCITRTYNKEVWPKVLELVGPRPGKRAHKPKLGTHA